MSTQRVDTPRPVADLGLGARTSSARRCPTCSQAFSGDARFCPFDGDPLVVAPDWDPASDPFLGRRIDERYEVKRVLGEGGMGTVYEVRHLALGRRFALKVLRRDLADPDHIERFVQEAKTAARLGHPNIVAVSDFGEVSLQSDGGAKVPYFVMEHLTGSSLSNVLRAEGALEPIRVAEIILQCASALAAAHDAGVIHRDIKPDNIFVTAGPDREYVKLLDFGVAKMAGVGRLTRAGMVFGTPHYMSPEQAAGEATDHRTDIYALGIILYECLAGKVPFEADTYMGVLTKHMFAKPSPIDRPSPDTSRLQGFEAIALRCLAKRPADRYPTMTALIEALEKALAEAQQASQPKGAPNRNWASRLLLDERGTGVGKSRTSIAILIGVGLITSCATLAVLSRFPRGRTARSEGPTSPSASVAPSSTRETATEIAASAAPISAPLPVAVPPSTQASATAAGAPTPRPRAKPSVSRGSAPAKRRPAVPASDVVDPWGK